MTAPSLPPPRWTVPPLETGGQVIARLSRLVEPRPYLSVSDWARRETNFDLEALPWHVEVMDALGDPQTAEVGLLGPSQIGKSTIGLCWIGWTIDRDPGDFGMVQPDRTMTHTFVVTRLEPFIEATDAVRKKLLPVAGANNIFLKQFQGMFIHSAWPVPSQLAQRPWRYGWVDDNDQIEADIGGTEDQSGQGSIIGLISGRQTSFEGRDTKFVSSSPADEAGGKTEAFVASGTDERLQPVCPSCGDRWEVDTLRDLRFDAKGTRDQAEASAHVVCPNGCVLKPEDRRTLLRSLIDLPNRGFVAANPEAGKRRRTFRVDGLMGFTSWEALAGMWRDAQIEWETRQDEGPLRSFVNTKAGKNYRSILSGEKPLKAADLGKRRDPSFAIGTVPAGVVCITVVVDAQATSFQCAAIGWGEKLQCWLIDRWSIDVADDGTPLRPFSDPSHADVLQPLWTMTWPLADASGESAPPLSVAIDTGGGGTKEDSWTSSVKALWHKATAKASAGGWGIERRRITLVKGGNNPNSPKLMPPAEFADKKLKGGAKRNSPDLWLPNVHRIKNILDAWLRKTRPGPCYVNLPGADRPGSPPRHESDGAPGISDEHLEELTAEELEKGRWKKIRARNETLDLFVMAIASLLKPGMAQSRDHMRWVPFAYRCARQEKPLMEDKSASGSIDETARDRADGQEPGAAAASSPAAAPDAPAKRRNRGINPVTGRRSGSWLQRN